MTESLVQCKLHAGFCGEGAETCDPKESMARCALTQSLQERRDAYRVAGVSIHCYDQINQLPAIKAERPEYADIHSQVLQDVLRRVDKAFQGFFRRLKTGQKPGYPVRRFGGRS